MLRYLISSCLALGALVASAAAGSAQVPKVVASIKPLHSLVAGVMGEVGTPALLVKGAGSPHSYSLRPSEARALEQADLVVWVGPGMERFLEKPLNALARKAHILQLAEVDGVTLLRTREGGAWEVHEHDERDEHADRADEDHGAFGHDYALHDMHLWLDPDNAVAIVAAVENALSTLDPGNAERYAENAAGLEAKIAALDADLSRQLAAVKSRPYVVFHDAYHYFEDHYGLMAVGSITLEPDRAPGARRLADLRQRIVEEKAVCVFSEPQFEPALVQTLIAGLEAKSGVLDPIGADLESGEEAYFALMRNLAASLVSCLEPTS